MSRHPLSLLASLGAGLIAAGALTGCATGAGGSPASSSEGSSASTPDAGSLGADARAGAAWLAGGQSIAVVTWGSSTCRPVVEGAPSFADGVVTVDTVLMSADGSSDPSAASCTEDLAPRALLVGLPEGADPAADLTIEVTGYETAETTLAGLAAPTATTGEFAPSAGWVDATTIAVLTYGSSGCPPTVESVTTTGSDIAVQFATPPADQVCTMDIAPRVTLADIGDQAPEGDASVVLSGGGVDATDPIPVLGSR